MGFSLYLTHPLPVQNRTGCPTTHEVFIWQPHYKEVVACAAETEIMGVLTDELVLWWFCFSFKCLQALNVWPHNFPTR